MSISSAKPTGPGLSPIGPAEPVGAGLWPLYLLSALAALHAIWLILEGVGPVDDDFIVYRYARHWVDGGSLAFNAAGPAAGSGPEPLSSEGFTSPLWLLLCALAQSLGLGPGLWTPLVGVISTALATLLTGLGARRVLPADRGRLALLPPALMALSPALAWHAVAGLGTVPMAAAIAGGVWAAAAGRWLWFASFMGVATLFRLEALVVALPIGLFVAIGAGSGRPAPEVKVTGGGALASQVMRWCAPVALVGVLVVLVRWQLFHRLAPATYFVKRLPVGDELEYGARYLMRATLEGGLPLAGLLAVIGMGERSPGKPGWLVRGLSVSSLLALLYVLACGGDWMVYGRFLVPLAPVLIVGAAASAGTWPSVSLRWGAALLLVASAVFGLRPAVRSQAIFEHHFFEHWWLEVGDALRTRAPEGASIAVSPIGAIGWRSQLEVVDILGLTHDAFLGLPPDLDGIGVKGHHRHDGAWVLDQEPTYLLLGNAVVQPGSGAIDVNPWERDIVADPRFQRDYVPETAWIRSVDGPRRALPYFRRTGARALAEE